MKINSSTRSQILFLLTAMVCVVASCSFSVVWMQQQISRVASACTRMEKALEAERDRLADVDADIAADTQPRELEARVIHYLRPWSEEQLVYVEGPRSPVGGAYASSVRNRSPRDLAPADAGIR